jgi:hypothetical protein
MEALRTKRRDTGLDAQIRRAPTIRTFLFFHTRVQFAPFSSSVGGAQMRCSRTGQGWARWRVPCRPPPERSTNGRQAWRLTDLHFYRMITVVVQQGDDVASERLAVEG